MKAAGITHMKNTTDTPTFYYTGTTRELKHPFLVIYFTELIN